jgi:excisionase family DNA binding protein
MSQNDLTVTEVMEVLGTSRKSIYRLRKQGEFPNSYKQDQKILIPRSDVDNYL